MSLARLVLAAVVVEGRSKSEVAREYGVSRRWVQKLTARYPAEGEAGLEPRSRRPRCSAQQVPAELEEEIVGLRNRRLLLALSRVAVQRSNPQSPRSAGE